MNQTETGRPFFFNRGSNLLPTLILLALEPNEKLPEIASTERKPYFHKAILFFYCIWENRKSNNSKYLENNSFKLDLSVKNLMRRTIFKTMRNKYLICVLNWMKPQFLNNIIIIRNNFIVMNFTSWFFKSSICKLWNFGKFHFVWLSLINNRLKSCYYFDTTF